MTIDSAAQFRDLWATARPGGWLGSDGTWSVRHPTSGAVLLWNGDTALDDPNETPPRTMPHHTFVIYDDDAQSLELVSRFEMIRPTLPNQWYWGGELVWDGPDLYAFATRLEATDGGWGFRQVGHDLVHLCWPVHEYPFAHVDGYYNSGGAWGDVDWGAGVASTPYYTYVFGVYSHPAWPSRWIFGKRVFVARVAPGDLSRRWRWEYLTPHGWDRPDPTPVNHDQLAPIISETGGPSGSFSVDLVDGVWKLVSKKHGDLGSEVTVWEAESVVGPWTPRKLFDAPWSSADMTYGARAHVGLPRTSGGKTLVSVNHNRGGATLADFYAPPYFYRPSWHEVTL